MCCHLWQGVSLTFIIRSNTIIVGAGQFGWWSSPVTRFVAWRSLAFIESCRSCCPLVHKIKGQAVAWADVWGARCYRHRRLLSQRRQSTQLPGAVDSDD